MQSDGTEHRLIADGCTIDALPVGWSVVAVDCARLRVAEDAFASVVLGVDEISAPLSLSDYVTLQLDVIRQMLPTVAIERRRGVMAHHGADEAYELRLEFVGAESLKVAQDQFYLRWGTRLAVVTTTAPATQWPRVEDACLRFRNEVRRVSS